MSYLKIILTIIFSISLYAEPLSVDSKSEYYNVLPFSQIYLDNTKELNYQTIQTKNAEFKDNYEPFLAFGYSPDFNVWLRFTLTNETDEPVEKILEYANPITTHITFFESSNEYQKDGLLTINPKRRTINPTFKISLKPYESKTYTIKAGSHITTLIVKLNLWEVEHYYNKEILNQVILALFFGAMIILGIYNLFIYLFTKDVSYLFYVLYIVGIIIHHLAYVGMSHIYLVKPDFIIYVVQFAPAIVALPIFAMALFTKTFLNIKQYPYLNKILVFFLFLSPISTLLFITTESFYQYRNLISLFLLLYLIAITIYAAFKKNRQAYFVLFGWIIIALAIIFMFLSSLGIFNVYAYFSYLIESAMLLEALIFSIALADRINYLKEERNKATNDLYVQQQNETHRLEITVNEKTKDLKIALNEKGLLLKELNHRVKNNMQTIISLIRLQSDEIEDEKIRDIFITIQNRINAMGHLHKLLYQQENISHVNAYEYFELLIEEIKESYINEVDISFNIQAELRIEQAIYCGLILNELITNAFKHAFKNNNGTIYISLSEYADDVILTVKDNGVGYDPTLSHNSLGLILVETLTKQQLRGTIETDTSDGVTVTLKWNNHA